MPEALRIASLHIKPQKAAPMLGVPSMALRSGYGIVGNAGPSGLTPRQVNIGFADSLLTHGVSHQGARCNIIFDGRPEPGFGAGSVIRLGDVALRVTMPCEPCSHGAQLAGVRTSHFREIERYLAIVVHGGILEPGMIASIQLRVYPMAPGDFRTRCAWALDYVPSGAVVGASEFLDAIGAGQAYARVLPRWMASARDQGKPVHRVLTDKLRVPSWCTNAGNILASEGISNPADARFDLMRTLWF